MAKTTEVQLLISAKDQASSKLKGVGSSLQKLASVGKVVGASLAIAGAGVVAFGIKSVKAFHESEEVSKKLETIVLNLKGATMEHVKALEDQAEALKKVGVLDDDTIKSAQAQLATFDLRSESIQKVIPGLLDMIVAEKGMNATMDDAKMAAQGLGKAFQGNFEVLSKQGFVITDAQKKMIELGNEEQKVKAITEILGTTYKGVNEAMANTSQGQLLKARQAFGDLEKSIGGVISNAITPFLPKITNAINSIPQEKIVQAGKYFEAFGKAVITVVGWVWSALKTLQRALETVFFYMFRAIDTARGAWNSLRNSITSSVNSIRSAWDSLRNALSKPITSIVNIVEKVTGKKKKRALGGGVSAGQSYLVGEQRPEVFVPHQSGNIRQTNQSGGGKVEVIFNNVNVRDDYDLDTIIKAVKDSIARTQNYERHGIRAI